MATHENQLIRAMQSPLLQAGGGAVLGGFFGLLIRVAGMTSGPVLFSVLGGAVVVTGVVLVTRTPPRNAKPSNPA